MPERNISISHPLKFLSANFFQNISLVFAIGSPQKVHYDKKKYINKPVLLITFCFFSTTVQYNQDIRNLEDYVMTTLLYSGYTVH